MEHTTGLPVKLGVLGKSLPHSLSPKTHADLLSRLGIDAVYDKYEMDERRVLHVIDFMKEKNLRGLNVTIPYKEILCGLVDVLDSHAGKIGAVNTVFVKDGISYGFNTDYLGAVSMFRRAGISLSEKKIVILGSGGASRALIYGFHLENAAKITVAARNVTAMRLLKKSFPDIDTCLLRDIPGGDILVNATPVGMFPNTGVSLADKFILRRFTTAADIVYNPLITEFLRIAKEEGLTTVTGLRMLVDQAIASEAVWFCRKLNFDLGNPIYHELAGEFLHTL